MSADCACDGSEAPNISITDVGHAGAAALGRVGAGHELSRPGIGRQSEPPPRTFTGSFQSEPPPRTFTWTVQHSEAGSAGIGQHAAQL